MEKIRVGVVGVGIGKAHVETLAKLRERFEVRVVCDVDEARAQAVANEFDVPRVVTDIQELFRDDALDVIDICTPSFLHYAQTLDALAAGKHVICEKPIAGSLQEADAMMATEISSGKRVMPIFQYRFGAGLQKLKYLQGLGLTGKHYLTTSETSWRRRPAYYAVPWRGKWQTELGGALVTLAIHAEDALQFILGEARTIAAQTATLVNPIETEDTASVSIQMADGSLVALTVTAGSAFEISRQRYCFENLVAESNQQPYTFTGDDWTFRGDSAAIDAQIAEALAGFHMEHEGREEQFSRFADAIEHGTELPVTLAQARVSLEWLTAIYFSAQSQAFVTLPIPREHPMYQGWRHETGV